jgi:hypothetical protein
VAEEETSTHVSFQCEPLATLRHTYLGSFFDPEGVSRSLSLGKIWNFISRKGSHNLYVNLRGTKGPSKKAYVHQD